jgi:hypothetical protein
VKINPRAIELIKIIKDTSAPRSAREAAIQELKQLRAIRERQTERERLQAYLEHVRSKANPDPEEIAFAESKLQQFDAESIPMAPEPDKPASAPQPDISGWIALHQYFHGPSLPPLGPLVAKVDLSDPSQVFWEREERQQADRAQAAKRIKPANPPIIVWGSDSEF